MHEKERKLVDLLAGQCTTLEEVQNLLKGLFKGTLLNGVDYEMKSYITKIELEESKPLVWRRVIMPAEAWFFL